MDSEIEKAREVEARIDFNQKYGVSTISSSSSLSYHRAGWLAGRQDIHSLENVFPDQGMVSHGQRKKPSRGLPHAQRVAQTLGKKGKEHRAA